MCSDSKKHHSFLALLFVAGDVQHLPVLRVVELSLERHRFAATSSSRTCVLSTHHRWENSSASW